MENLLKNKDFVDKRIKEQNDYIEELSDRLRKGEITGLRFFELMNSALGILENFEHIKYGRDNPPL